MRTVLLRSLISSEGVTERIVDQSPEKLSWSGFRRGESGHRWRVDRVGTDTVQSCVVRISLVYAGMPLHCRRAHEPKLHYTGKERYLPGSGQNEHCIVRVRHCGVLGRFDWGEYHVVCWISPFSARGGGAVSRDATVAQRPLPQPNDKSEVCCRVFFEHRLCARFQGVASYSQAVTHSGGGA